MISPSRLDSLASPSQSNTRLYSLLRTGSAASTYQTGFSAYREFTGGTLTALYKEEEDLSPGEAQEVVDSVDASFKTLIESLNRVQQELDCYKPVDVRHLEMTASQHLHRVAELFRTMS